MNFAQTMDIRWRRRHHSSHFCRKPLPVRTSTHVRTKAIGDAPACFAAAAAAATAAGATGDRYAPLSWHPYQVHCCTHGNLRMRMDKLPFGRADRRGGGIADVGTMLLLDSTPAVPEANMAAFGGLGKEGIGEGEKDDVGFGGWKDGLGRVARVLALSVKK